MEVLLSLYVKLRLLLSLYVKCVHLIGVDLPGFLHGSNFLLPWDITVKTEKDKWPSVGEMSRKSKQKKNVKGTVPFTNLWRGSIILQIQLICCH